MERGGFEAGLPLLAGLGVINSMSYLEVQNSKSYVKLLFLNHLWANPKPLNSQVPKPAGKTILFPRKAAFGKEGEREREKTHGSHSDKWLCMHSAADVHTPAMWAWQVTRAVQPLEWEDRTRSLSLSSNEVTNLAGDADPYTMTNLSPECCEFVIAVVDGQRSFQFITNQI